jgi:hypothetical protein
MKCVFYPRLKCPVREEIARVLASRLAESSPIITDEDRIAAKFFEAFSRYFPQLSYSSELSVLQYYCALCVKKRIMDERYVQKHSKTYKTYYVEASRSR